MPFGEGPFETAAATGVGLRHGRCRIANRPTCRAIEPKRHRIQEDPQLKKPMGSSRWPFKRSLPLLLLLLLLPGVLGGCPEFANDMISALDAFTRNVLNAVVDVFFDQFRGDNFS